MNHLAQKAPFHAFFWFASDVAAALQAEVFVKDIVFR